MVFCSREIFKMNRCHMSSDRDILVGKIKARKKINGMYPKRPVKTLICLCSICVLLTIIGLVLLCAWPLIYNYILESAMTLSPESKAYEMWKKNPLPLDLKIFVFNWTNPHEVRNVSVKPRFQQMGPYTFTETKEKVNISWNSNGTVTFRHLKKWYFDPGRSNGSLMDPVTTINAVALSATYLTRDWNKAFKTVSNILFPTVVTSVEVTTTIGELLFEGYEDSLLNMANSLPKFIDSKAPKMDKFGWFYGRNGSENYEGTFNMDTGSYGTLGELYQWNYEGRTPYFPDRCGKIDGSAGEFFPKDLKKEDLIKFFNSDLCRFAELEFEEEVVVNGILGYKYTAGERFLDNGTKYLENKCFCSDDCNPSGAINISACRYGSPAFVSLPHFQKADPYYLSLLEGLKPDNKSHEFFMIFEPKTGMPLQVAARLQLNLLLQPLNGARLYRDIIKVYFPVLWFEQVVTLPDDMTFYAKLLLNFGVICTSLGASLIVIGWIVMICMCYKICTTNLFGKKGAQQQIKEEMPLNQ